MKLIINADDLGISPKVNDAIEKAIRMKKISSSTILANTKFQNEVKRIVELYPHMSFGAHLNISEGLSFYPCEQFYDKGLIDENGCFIMQNCRKLEYMSIDSELKQCIKNEWDIQLSRLFDYKIPVSHIDGHQYCQTWYGLTDILIELAKKYHITKIRRHVDSLELKLKQKIAKSFSSKLYDFNINLCEKNDRIPNFFKSIVPYQCEHSYQNKIAKGGISTTDMFVSFSSFLLHRRLLSHDIIVELMTHPGHKKFEKETEALMNFDLGTNEEMISYNEL